MNILFLTMHPFYDIHRRSIYTDLMRRFMKDGHHVYVVAPREKRHGQETTLLEGENYSILIVRTGNQSHVSLLEKGLSTIFLKSDFLHAIDKYYSGVHFDCILYSTPPITLAPVVRKLKKRDGARTLLMLKDIFPQNAVDLGMFRKWGLVYHYFRHKEQELYRQSDVIGCMSQANIDYVRKHNPEVPQEKVVLCPNSMDLNPFQTLAPEERDSLRKKHGIPLDATVFLYGGNLGKPQGVDFLLECLRCCRDMKKVFFALIGSGNEYQKIERFCATEGVQNVKLISELPKDEYERLVGAFDVGLIFLDHRFTIPNYPSRLLSYLNSGLPVLATTDPNTDIGGDIVKGGFGWWCESNDTASFRACVEETLRSNLPEMGRVGRKYMEEHFTTDVVYASIKGYLGL